MGYTRNNNGPCQTNSQLNTCEGEQTTKVYITKAASPLTKNRRIFAKKFWRVITLCLQGWLLYAYFFSLSRVYVIRTNEISHSFYFTFFKQEPGFLHIRTPLSENYCSRSGLWKSAWTKTVLCLFDKPIIISFFFMVINIFLQKPLTFIFLILYKCTDNIFCHRVFHVLC